jgi:hypothetical protein
MQLQNREPTLAGLCLLADAGCTIHDSAEELHASCRWLNHGVHRSHVHSALHCDPRMHCFNTAGSVAQHQQSKEAL